MVRPGHTFPGPPSSQPHTEPDSEPLLPSTRQRLTCLVPVPSEGPDAYSGDWAREYAAKRRAWQRPRSSTQRRAAGWTGRVLPGLGQPRASP